MSHDCIAGSGVQLTVVICFFFKVLCWPVMVFKWLQALKTLHQIEISQKVLTRASLWAFAKSIYHSNWSPTYLFFWQIFGPDSPDSGKSSSNSLSSNSVTINTNPFLDDEPEISSDNITNNKPKPPPKKRNSDDSTTKLNDSRNVTPTKPLPLPTKAYRAPPPPSNKPSPAVRARVKAIVGSGKQGVKQL